MPTLDTTTYLGISYPTSGNDGTDFGTGVADMATGVDGIIPAALSDVLVAGVTSAGAGAVANAAVSSAGAVSCTGLGAGNAYILLTTGILVRNVVPTGSYSATPSLPATGKYACVGIDLVGTAWGGTASVALSSKGSDQTTAALALANPPSVASGHLRLMNVVIENTSGSYSLAATSDLRAPAQTGPSAISVQSTSTTGLTNTSLATPGSPCYINLTLAAPAILTVSGRAVADKTGGSTPAIYAGLLLDGAEIANALGGPSAGYCVATALGSTSPTASAVFLTGSQSAAVSVGGTSGSGDFAYASTSTAMLLGTPVAILVPTGTHQLAWGFSCDSGGTYQVVSQALAVHL